MEEVKHTIFGQGHPVTDAELVEKVLAGDKELYELLMRRHNQKLYRVIRSYLKNEKEVEDAMQDTYLKAFEKLHQFRHDALFSTWLIRIGINTALGQLRKDRKLANAHTDLMDYTLLNIPDTQAMNPEYIIIHEETKHLLEKAIDAIPDKYRVVYTLRELEEMSIQEVMECLGLSESNVKIRLHRAKTLLKENLYALASKKHLFEFGSSRCDGVVRRVIAQLP